MTLLISFLNGELSVRFVLKVLAVLIIAGAVFVHYLSDLKDKGFSWMSLLDKIFIILVVIGIIAGFWIAGSPAHQRDVRFDEQRVNDLATIQSQVIYFWQAKQRLPQNLDELTTGVEKFIAPKDPETGADYDYRIVKSPYSFELCAVFLTSSTGNQDQNVRVSYPVTMGYDPSAGDWGHGIGNTCFERTIDPDVIKPLVK